MNGAIRKTKITAQHENIINHMGYLLMLEGHASMIKGLTMLTDLSSMDVAEEGTTWADVDALYAKVSTDDDAPVTAA